MNRLNFATQLSEAVIDALRRFRKEHPDETPYGFAIICGQVGQYLGFAIATEERLLHTAARYGELGYCYEGFEDEPEINIRRLTDWLRWSNPEDGWFFSDFAERFDIAGLLRPLVNEGAFGEAADKLEEFCTEVLGSLQTNHEWIAMQGGGQVITGVTEGQNPDDFLRTATRCNSFNVAKELWSEKWRADECSARIKRPKSKY
jgi:hypothetical protein